MCMVIVAQIIPQWQSGQKYLNVGETHEKMTKGQVALLMSSAESKLSYLHLNVVLLMVDFTGIASWVPRNINMQDRQQRVESSQELLEVNNVNPEDFDTRHVTEYETGLNP